MIPDVQLATSITPLVDKILVPFEHNHNHRIRKCPFSELPFGRRVLDSRTVHFLESHCNTPWGNTSHSNSDRIKPCCVLPRTNKQTKKTQQNKTNLFFFPPLHTLESFMADCNENKVLMSALRLFFLFRNFSWYKKFVPSWYFLSSLISYVKMV